MKKILPSIIIFLILDFIAASFLLEQKKYHEKKYRIPNNVYHHTLKKNINADAYWGKRVYQINTDQLGFKTSPKKEKSKSNYTKKVLVMGDSFTEGIGVNYDETFVGTVQNTMPDIKIYNAAVASYSPKLYYLKTAYLLDSLNLKVDELIVFIDLSDIQDEILYQGFHSGKSNDLFLRGKQRLLAYARYKSVLGHLFFMTQKKEFKNLEQEDEWVKKKLSLNTRREFLYERAKWSFIDGIYNKWGKEGVALAKKNLVRLLKLCEKHGINVKMVVYPWPDQIKEKISEDRQVKIWRKFCKKYDIEFFNLYPLFFKGNSPKETIEHYFIKGDVHWNENGHQLVADELVNNIL